MHHKAIYINLSHAVFWRKNGFKIKVSPILLQKIRSDISIQVHNDQKNDNSLAKEGISVLTIEMLWNLCHLKHILLKFLVIL